MVSASEVAILPSTHNEAISDYTITTRYARYDHKKKRRETWKEMIERVRDMHKFRYGAKGINKEIDWAFEQVLDKRVLPSMRSLQFGGDAIIANDARIYNCSFTLADRQRFFSEALWLLLSGVGVGFSVQKQHVAKLPKLVKHADASEKEVSTYVVGDTIEGWADAIEILMNSYFVGNPLSGKEVFFDYSRIRRKGSWLKTSGGRAPGPKPLMRAVKQIKKLLHDVAESGCDQLRPINVYDIAMIAADCVLAGGIRRSATICLFSLDDEEMMQAKTMMKRSRVLSNKSKEGTWLTDLGEAINLKNDKGNDPEAGEDVNIGWFNICPWRARSNNSVALLRNKCKFEDFEKIVNSAKAYGEPGFVFLDNLDYGYNPCLTGDTRLLTKNGYIMMEKLWEDGGKQDYDKYKKAEDYGLIDIVNSNGVVKATNVYKTSDSSPIYEIELENGQTIKATANHKFFKINDKNKERVRLDELKVGDKLPLINNNIIFGNYDNPDYALLSGWVTGDGSLSENSNGLQRAHVVVYDKDLNDALPILRRSLLNLYNSENKSTEQNPEYTGCEQNPKNFNFTKKTMESIVLGRMMAEDGCHYGIPSENVQSTKHKVPIRIWQGDKRTISSYLKGLFSADGTVNISDSSVSCCVKLSQSNKPYLQEIQLLLLQFGITSSINFRREAKKMLMNDGKGGKKYYNCKNQYELCISGVENNTIYNNMIGFIQNTKSNKLNNWLLIHKGSYNSNIKYHSNIKSIEYIGDQPTYCLTEPENNEIVANSLIIGNCCEIGLNPIDPKNHATGWGFCNLCEINGGKIKSIEDYKVAVKSATIIGTMQAGFTYLHYLTDTTRNIVRREALLGISITGWMDNPDILLNAENQREMAKYAVEINKEFSEKIGIPSAARVTCTKPSGSTSLVLGTSSGIHPHHSRRYFRRIVANSVEQPLRYFALHNPKMIEKSVWGTNDEVITFCIEVSPTAILKNDLTAIQFLDNVKKTYENWVFYGTARPDSSPGLTHNVSNTVLVDEHEWEEVTKYIFKNRHCFSGISLLPKSGDKIYKQAPFEKVETEADIKKWNELVSEYQPVDWSLFEENEDYTSLKDIIACTAGSCER
jgi:intein/homing endonuclease